jgi:hypothetical protein
MSTGTFLSKNFKVLEKPKAQANTNLNHSVILEHRNKNETLLFESQAVAVLCKFLHFLFFVRKKTKKIPLFYVITLHFLA